MDFQKKIMSTVPHEEWVAEVQSKPMFSTVGDVVTTGMFKKVTTYGVSSGKTEACSDNTVRRRYSDFEWLYNLLCTRYQALVVPNIPPKGGMTGGGEAFMQRRVAGLTRFLKCCSVSPFIKADPSFQHFLTSDGTSGQWDTLKKTASSQCHQNFLTRPVIDQYRAHGMELATGDGAGDEANDDKIIAAYTRLAKTGAPTLSKVDASINMLGKAGGASDQATIDLTTKINLISEITTGADGDNAIISALGDFQSIVSVVNGAFEGFTTHQTFGYGVASVHLLPATHEVGVCFSEITVAMNRLKTLRKALTSSEKAKGMFCWAWWKMLLFVWWWWWWWFAVVEKKSIVLGTDWCVCCFFFFSCVCCLCFSGLSWDYV